MIQTWYKMLDIIQNVFFVDFPGHALHILLIENVNNELHCTHQHVIDVSRQRKVSLTCNEVFISR